MKYVTELLPRVNMDDRNIHASVISGKVRVSTFTYTATEADTQLTLAFLPAGRGRALPIFSWIECTGVTAAMTIGTGAYLSSVPGEGEQPAVVDNLALSFTPTDQTPTAFVGATEGIPYHSIDGIPIIATGTFPVGCIVKGIMVYNVT